MKILFIDTETSGFYKPPSGDEKKDPFIVELGAILFDLSKGDDSSMHTLHRIIQPAGRWLNPHAVAVHGIDAAKANKVGRPEAEVMQELVGMIEVADAICCHNVDFDYKFVADALARCQLLKSWERLLFLPQLCTMKLTVDFCQLPFGNPARKPKAAASQRYKWPKLEELHQKLFGESFENSHSAFSDVMATLRCFIELYNKHREIFVDTILELKDGIPEEHDGECD